MSQEEDMGRKPVEELQQGEEGEEDGYENYLRFIWHETTTHW